MHSAEALERARARLQSHRGRIARNVERIRVLEEMGHDTRLARQVLQTLRAALVMFEDHYRSLGGELDGQ
jgi:hypothetical protein